jgi:hypothetical protein
VRDYQYHLSYQPEPVYELNHSLPEYFPTDRCHPAAIDSRAERTDDSNHWLAVADM